MPTLDPPLKQKLIRFALALVDQQRARLIVPPQQANSGYWFGGGNLIEDADGSLILVGRFRSGGDSRTGLVAGQRGHELAVFRSTDGGQTFEKDLSFGKPDLDVGDKRVLSIEGAAIARTESGIELFVSTEKDHVGYPPGFEEHLKPGTGVWSIERLRAPTIDGLIEAPRETVASSCEPEYVHIKDPFLYNSPQVGRVLLFCSHPYCWTSSNTGYAVPGKGGQSFDKPVFDFFPRGFTWDVAMTRGTCIVDIPPVGAFRDLNISLMFYDGGECVRNHSEHAEAVSRSRGYSCEELGGAAYIVDGDLDGIERLSVHRPLFVSPYGSGCSRYVDVLATDDGFYTTWQQSQPDGSQPMVMNFLAKSVARELLE